MYRHLTQITNPVINPELGTQGAEGSPDALANLIGTLWRVFLTLGALAVLIFIAWGAFSWITSGGDKAQVEAARNRIINAIIGMAILFSLIALVAYLFPMLGFDILNPVIENNLE